MASGTDGLRQSGAPPVCVSSGGLPLTVVAAAFRLSGRLRWYDRGRARTGDGRVGTLAGRLLLAPAGPPDDPHTISPSHSADRTCQRKVYGFRSRAQCRDGGCTRCAGPRHPSRHGHGRQFVLPTRCDPHRAAPRPDRLAAAHVARVGQRWDVFGEHPSHSPRERRPSGWRTPPRGDHLTVRDPHLAVHFGNAEESQRQGAGAERLASLTDREPELPPPSARARRTPTSPPRCT